MVRVLYEDGDVIVVDKPAGMESQSSHLLEPDMVSELKNYLKSAGLKQGGGNGKRKGADIVRGEPYLGVIHRLDKPVGGVMVYAKTKKAAADLSRQVRERQMEKQYMAVVCGKFVDKSGFFVDYLWKDGKNNTSKLVDKGKNGARLAELSYRVVEEIVDDFVDDVDNFCGQPLSLVEIRLNTGRHHQIRVQFAGRGLPLWGDRKYGEGCKALRGEHVALYADRLSFIHPVSGRPLTIVSCPQAPIFMRFHTVIKNMQDLRER